MHTNKSRKWQNCRAVSQMIGEVLKDEKRERNGKSARHFPMIHSAVKSRTYICKTTSHKDRCLVALWCLQNTTNHYCSVVMGGKANNFFFPFLFHLYPLLHFNPAPPLSCQLVLNLHLSSQPPQTSHCWCVESFPRILRWWSRVWLSMHQDKVCWTNGLVAVVLQK